MRLHEYQRRSLLPLAGLALATYYFMVVVPLQRKAESLDPPLQKAWQKLAASLSQSNSYAIDFLNITNQLRETRQALSLLETARQKVTARLELGDAVRARLGAPFQLVEYEDQRSKLLDDLAKLARQQQAAIEPAVFTAFPEQTADMLQPALLWPALAFVDCLLTSALRCHVVAIHSLDVPLALASPPAAEPDRARGWTEIPLQLEFTASFADAARFIQGLPLRADELRAAGLPEAPPEKPVLFIDRLAIKKQSPDKADEVRVFLRVVGFVFHE